MKALVACLGEVTAAVDPAQWPGAVRPFGLLLQLLLDERPKVRKRAQDAAQAVLVGLQGTSARQPASEAVLKSALLRACALSLLRMMSCCLSPPAYALQVQRVRYCTRPEPVPPVWIHTALQQGPR